MPHTSCWTESSSLCLGCRNHGEHRERGIEQRRHPSYKETPNWSWVQRTAHAQSTWRRRAFSRIPRLEDGVSGRTALTARPVARNAKLRLGLRRSARMADQLRIDHLAGGQRERGRMGCPQQSHGTIRALLWQSPELRLVAGWLGSLRHSHHAMMFAVPPAARRQVCFTLRREREERRGKRQPEEDQQRNGDNLPQLHH